jgi:hypothetical protein
MTVGGNRQWAPAPPASPERSANLGEPASRPRGIVMNSTMAIME